MKVKKIMEDASRKILNKDSSTDFMCGVEWQLIRYAMIQDKSEQEKWNRIMDIVNKHTQGKYTWVDNQGKNCAGTPGSTTQPHIISSTKYVYR
jgi:hypothetical protein